MFLNIFKFHTEISVYFSFCHKHCIDFFIMLTVKPEPVVQIPDRPVLSEEEIERKSKSIIDEFLHINDFKVLRFKSSKLADVF